MTKVMIVDDDRTMVSLLQTLLELDGFQVVQAGSAQSFVDQVQDERPDAVLMDVFLSDREGYDLVRELRQAQDTSLAKVPVIMTSGMELSIQCQQAGADAFLLKPYDPEQLLRVIHDHLDGAQID
jgi:DNA-binding response OmpR family regulator